MNNRAFALQKRIIVLTGMLSSTLFGLYLACLGFVLLNSNPQPLDKADVAIVLGATPYWGKQWNPCLKARVDESVRLYKKGTVKALLMSGGKEPKGSLTEAAVMKEMAIAAGMDERFIFLEERATSTEENIEYSKPFLDYFQASSVIIVSEPYHTSRGRLVGNTILSQSVQAAPATASPCWQGTPFKDKNVWREPVALLYYLFTGKI